MVEVRFLVGAPVKDSIAKIKRQLAAYGEVEGRRCYVGGSPVPYDCDGCRGKSYPRPDNCISKGYIYPRSSFCKAEVYSEDNTRVIEGRGEGWREAWEKARRAAKLALRFHIDNIERERR